MRRRTRLTSFAAGVLLSASVQAFAQPAEDAAAAMKYLEEEAVEQPACDPATETCDTAEDSAGVIDPGDDAGPIEQIDAPFGKAVLGAPDGDFTLVVFADYACHACREAQTVIDQLIARDPKLRVVYRVLVNEEEGREAALTSLAVAQTGGDWSKFHHALDAGQQPTSASIAKALADSGIDRARLPRLDQADAVNAAIFDEVARNGMLVHQREAQAIPAWVIGEGVAQNGFELEPLEAAIAAARASK